MTRIDMHTAVPGGTDPVWDRLVSLANKRNIPVYLARGFDRNVDGLWLKTNEVEAIVLAQRLKGDDRNFTLAHELGHSALHRIKSPGFMGRNLPGGPERAEAEADRFAGKLLHLLKKKSVASVKRPNPNPPAGAQALRPIAITQAIGLAA